MCHHKDHFKTDEQNDYREQRGHEQTSHGSFHWLWFLFPFLFFPFFTFHIWNAFGILFWVAPVILFSLGMKAASCTSHHHKAVAMPKDVPFYTLLLPRADEQGTHPLLLESDAQENVTKQAWMQQREQEVYTSPFAEEQPQISSPQEILTQE